MAMKLSHKELSKAHDRLQALRKRVGSIKEKAEEATEKLVTTAEVGAASFAMGVINGKTGGVELMGVPLELGVGGALVAVSMLGIAGKASHHLHNFGTGALASYLTTVGRGVGLSMGGGTATPKQVTKGDVGLSPEEIAMASAMANQ